MLGPGHPVLRRFALPLAFLPVIPGGCVRPPGVAAGEAVRLVRVADGFTSPVAMAIPDDGTGRVFIVDQVGVVHLLNGDGTKAAGPFLDLRDRMIELSPTYDERGLLGLAFHPEFASNGRFFVVYNAPGGESLPAGFDSELRLAEFTTSQANPDVADPGTGFVLLRIPKPQFNHNGGQLAFGTDGMLYMSVGDGGGANDEGLGHTPGIGNGQDLSTLLGKVLRIDVDAGDAGTYGVPADNPFSHLAEARPEIWAYGLRNPWRFSFDAGGDHRMFLADAGQDLFEEVNIIVKGGNYGWRIREGFSCFNPLDPGAPLDSCPDHGPNGNPLVEPILDFGHTSPAGIPVGTVVIGGYVYRGKDLPELVGDYVFGDFTTIGALPNGVLYAARENETGAWDQRQLRLRGSASGELDQYVLAFGQDLEGEIYVLTTGNFGPVGETGAVYRLEAAP